jgi:NAD(P)-dependent dehydrogenase (short-subunit alcohol dehydrogenase family)
MSAGRLAGRVALITGGAAGIGQATAKRFIREGADVVVLDRDEAALPAAGVAGDVTDPAAVVAAVDAAIARHGGLDIVVNNAGIIGYTSFLDLSLDEWNRVQQTNLTGTFLVSQAAARRMLELEPGPRSILNLASVEGRRVVARSGHPQVHYGASKAAIEQFTHALAVELAPWGIRVNALCPGLIRTRFTEAALADPDARAWLLDRIPLGRPGEPEDVAAAAAFLTSDDAAYITGTALVVDGGWLTS